MAKRTAELASQLKEGLAGMSNILLWTPRTADLSAGIVSFDLVGRPPGEVVAQLRQKNNRVGALRDASCPLDAERAQSTG